MPSKRTGLYSVIDAINTEFRGVGFAYVGYGLYTEMDLDKQSLFPYCQIVIPNANEVNIMTTLQFDIVVTDIVDFQKGYTNTMNEVFDPTNTLDIHQDLMAKVQQALKLIDRNYIDIDVILPITWRGFKENFSNTLAGWTLTVGFEVPNMDSWTIC